MDNCKEKIDLGHYWDLKGYWANGREVRNPIMSNRKHEYVPLDQVSSLLVVYCSLFLHLK